MCLFEQSGWFGSAEEPKGPPPPTDIRIKARASTVQLNWKPFRGSSGTPEKRDPGKTSTQLMEAAYERDKANRERGTSLDPTSFSYKVAYAPVSGLVSAISMWSYLTVKGKGFCQCKVSGLYESTRYAVQICTIGKDGEAGPWSERFEFSTCAAADEARLDAEEREQRRTSRGGRAEGGGGEERKSGEVVKATTIDEYKDQKKRDMDVVRESSKSRPSLGTREYGDPKLTALEKEVEELRAKLSATVEAKKEVEGVAERLAKEKEDAMNSLLAELGQAREAQMKLEEDKSKESKEALERNEALIRDLLEDIRLKQVSVDTLRNAGPNPALEAELCAEGWDRETVRFFFVVVDHEDRSKFMPFLQRHKEIRESKPDFPDEAVRQALVSVEDIHNEQEIDAKVATWLEQHQGRRIALEAARAITDS